MALRIKSSELRAIQTRLSRLRLLISARSSFISQHAEIYRFNKVVTARRLRKNQEIIEAIDTLLEVEVNDL